MAISDAQATRFGFLVVYAEDMYAPGQTVPRDEPRIGELDWEIVAYLIARDAVLPDRASLAPGNLKTLQLNQTVFYGYLARSKSDPTSFVAAVRGTSGFVEWVIDANFLPRDCPSAPGTMVENGFWSIYETMTLVGLNGAPIGAKAADGIAKVVGAGNVTIAGHSLGSALATYLSFDVARILGSRASACLFASPRTGDHAWVSIYGSTVGDYRLINYVLDVVPYVPFDAPPFQYSTLQNVTLLQPATAQAEVRFDLACNHHVICYCAMIDYADTKKLADAEDFGTVRFRAADIRPQPRTHHEPRDRRQCAWGRDPRHRAIAVSGRAGEGRPCVRLASLHCPAMILIGAPRIVSGSAKIEPSAPEPGS
jgi:triacylglycerol lipase